MDPFQQYSTPSYAFAFVINEDHEIMLVSAEDDTYYIESPSFHRMMIKPLIESYEPKVGDYVVEKYDDSLHEIWPKRLFECVYTFDDFDDDEYEEHQ